VNQKLEDLLLAQFPQSQVHLKGNPPKTRIHGRIVWEGFSGMDQISRQDMLWKVIRNHFGVQAAEISTIFTFTPQVERLMAA
jgi:acid stress-induced BolA-like protein IbaG/YrbA